MTRSFAFLAAAIALSGCVRLFDHGSELVHQEYLCDEEHAQQWQDAVRACSRAWLAHENPGPGTPPPTCAGVLSMRGQLGGKALVVTDTQMEDSVFRRATVAGPTNVYLGALEFSGIAPHFLFTFNFDAIGGAQTETQARELGWSVRANVVDPPLERFEDTLAFGELRIENGRESTSFVALTDSGVLRLDRQTSKEISGSFEAAFKNEEDRLSGCFHLFANEIRYVAY